MSRALLRAALSVEGRHLSPFLVLGDPTPQLSVALCRTAVEAGATMLELGIPYGDPCADGPAVQAACARARSLGVSTDGALAALAEVRGACPRTPLNLLVYGNLVHARGFDRFCSDAVAAGASSLLVPDIPLEEGAELRAACKGKGLGIVTMAAPRTPPVRLCALSAAADCFVYLAGHQGVTGTEGGPDRERNALVAAAAEACALPLCVGFGLRRREQVASVFDQGAAIAVVGSHLVRVLQQQWTARPGDGPALVAAVRKAFVDLMPATDTEKEQQRCS